MKIYSSVIDISSTITTSASIGLFSSLANCAPPSLFHLYSSSLWIVFASDPVASSILFAALPVGAQSATFFRKFLKIAMIHFIIVVLPTPGPPVIIATPFSIALLIASFWLSWNVTLYVFSYNSISWSKSIWIFSCLNINLFMFSAIFLSTK